MFTLIRNYRTLFMACIARYGVENTAAASPDAVQADNILTTTEQKALRELFEKGIDKVNYQTKIDSNTLLKDFINNDVRSKVEGLIGKTGIQEIQQKLGLTVDGEYGVETSKAIARYQRSKGLLVDGIAGPNTLAAVRGNPSQKQKRAVRPKVKTSSGFGGLLDSLGDLRDGFIDSLTRKDVVRYNTLNSLKSVDNDINATSGLSGLDRKIRSISNTQDPSKVEDVYNDAIKTLKGKLSAKNYKLFSSAKNPTEKLYVLGFISNALMGGGRSVNVVKGKESAKGYIALINDTRRLADRQIASDGFSATLIAEMNDARNQNIAALKTGNKVTSRRIGKASSALPFSLRLKDGYKGLQAFGPGATEALSIGNKIHGYNIDVPESDILLLASKLNKIQLSGIATRLGRKNVSSEKVMQLIKDGKLKASMQYHMAENCGNDSLMLLLKYPTIFKRTEDNQDDDNNNKGKVSTGTGTEGVGRNGGKGGVAKGGTSNTTTSDTRSNGFG